MAKEFHNLNELFMVMENPMKIASEYVAEQIINELNIQIAVKKIGLNSNSFYNPTGEFYSAWGNEIANNIEGMLSNGVSTEVGFDYSELSIDRDNFIHGSNIGGANDMRQWMPDLVFGGNSGKLFGEGFWTQERDAWTPTMRMLSKNFDKWLKEGFAKSGLTITKKYNV